jgi:hypothetical protein
VNGFLKGGLPSAETFITNSEASKQATTFGCSVSETSTLAAADAWYIRTAAIAGSSKNILVIFYILRPMDTEISHITPQKALRRSSILNDIKDFFVFK